MEEKIIDLAHGHLTGIFDIQEYCNDNNIDILNIEECLIDNNGLTEIVNLHKAKNLKVLVCTYNNIKELSINNIINLQELVIDEGVMTC